MVEQTRFMRAYFIQTRREIDTEKRERDQMLNFALAILGAIGFAVAQSETAQKYLHKPESMAIEIPAVIIISTLFWIRYKKLHQISDRWFVLHRLATRHFGKKMTQEILEGIVVKNLTRWRYIRKDFMLNIALCLPIYGLIVLQGMDGYLLGQYWRISLAIASITTHFSLSSYILGRKIKDPLPPLDKNTRHNKTAIKD